MKEEAGAPGAPGGKPARYLITGVYGFIGREIAVQLCAKGYAVRGLAPRKKAGVPMPDGLELVTGDVLDPASLDALFNGIDPRSAVLIHAAALISVRRRNELCERVNFIGAENVLAACKKRGVRLIHFSSVDALPMGADGAADSEPRAFFPERLPTAYGRSKAAAAQRVLDEAREGLDCAVLLPSAVIGPGDYRRGFVTKLLELYLKLLLPLGVAGGYEFVDVRDVARAAIAASQRPGRGECYILSNRYADMTEVLDALAAVAGKKPGRRLVLPLWSLVPFVPLLSAACRLLGKEPPLTVEALRLMAAHPAYRCDRAARELDFNPRPLAETLADTAAFILEQRGGGKTA